MNDSYGLNDCYTLEDGNTPVTYRKRGSKTTMSKFKEGDIIRLKNGSAPIKVVQATSSYVYGTYVNSGKNSTGYPQDYVHYEDNNNDTQQTKETDMNTLYEVKDSVNNITKFATKLAVNSQGQWVMEEKGTGVVFSIDKKDAVEVTPYTIEIQFLGNTNGNSYSYFADADKYNVGDMFSVKSGVTGLGIAVVTKVDTKSKAATKDFGPIVLQKFVTESV